MLLSRLRAVGVLLLAGIFTVHGQQASPVNRPWPPAVQKTGPESPPLSPEQALETFYMPPGYRLELVASEPLVQEPVALDWDLEGRLWVVEMPGWMPDITAAGEHDPIGRVVVLEDQNADGRMDKRTVFAEGLVLARSIEVLDRGVLVGEPPHAWLMVDTDGDLRMDRKELVTDQYGRREIDPQNNANGFNWSLDNRMYTAGQADIHLRLKNGKFEVEKTLRRGEWGVTHDDAGRVYRNTNESALHVDLVPTFYYARNPNLLRTRGSYERLSDLDYELNTVWPVRPNPGTNRAYQVGIDRPDGTLARFTSVCAPVVFRGDRLPPDVYGNVFVAEPAANLVSRLVLEDGPAGVRAHKAYERGEFLASTDERFRPVFISNAPDGTLYIADLYRGIIEHKISITMYLRDQILERKLEGPTGLGRIYRVVHETTQRDTSRPLVPVSTPKLVEALTHPNGWWRDTAQRLLVERRQADAAPALVKLAQTAKDSRTRLHALWTLDALDALEPPLVIAALEDPSRDVRGSAVRLAERWMTEAGHPVHAALARRADDSDAAVRRQLAASIGTMPAAIRDGLVASLLDRHGDDPVTMDAALSGLRGGEADVLARLMTLEGGPTPQREAAMTMIAATLVRSGQDAAVQDLLGRAADDARPAWQRSAVLRGAEVALLGAAMPGTPAPGRRGGPPTAKPLPCPTCPGGRAGPGGAYAFPRTTAAPAGGRGGGPVLRLSREPAAFLELASGSGDLAPRAKALLARVSWPGKPGDAAPVRPLTAPEQQRFTAGGQIYRNICQSCHQPDGRGQDKVAPSLIGSELALASADIPARVLLHGKEGAIGLMPPIGASLDDDQLASVLTYIRREWGNGADPVTPDAVKAVRAATAARTRPWTDAELKALAAGTGRK
jgi:mono/diheme cytochrome c family protein/glucose/arabinose dehydrogenase